MGGWFPILVNFWEEPEDFQVYPKQPPIVTVTSQNIGVPSWPLKDYNLHVYLFLEIVVSKHYYLDINISFYLYLC